MSTNPRVSVVMPVYNGATYVNAAIRSILKQTYADFELFLLDDGSTDESPAILNKFATQDNRCKFQALPHRGIAETRNIGVNSASGEFIACMDQDDISRPERFATQVGYLDKHPDCVAVGTTAVFIDADGLPMCNFFGAASHAEIDACHMRGKGRICNPSVMMRTAAVKRVGGYRREYEYSEDLDLFLRLAEVGELVSLPHVLFEYRQHFAAGSYQKRKSQTLAANAAVEDAAARRGKTVQRLEIASDISPAVVYRNWAWWALSGGNKASARKHALKAFMSSPLDIATLRLVACVIRGH
jgi:glycosyltransferase involved in cell wall biosynthesis